jgi:hypothetical protein
VIPKTSRPRSLSHVIADGHHGLPNSLHGFDEQLVDPIGISFGIEHGAREIDRDESVACP